MKQDRTLWISFGVGIGLSATGLVFILMGWSELGIGIFCVLPFVIGLISGILPNSKQALIGMGLTLLVVSIFLLFTEMEGVICILLATPIIFAAMGIGWLIARLFGFHKKDKDKRIPLSVAPLLLFFAVNFFEIISGTSKIPASVASTVILDAAPSQVYSAIIEVDTVDVEPAFLQKLGLPIPRKCILTEAAVGGQRICVFEEGTIIETITELQPNKMLRMDVSSCDLGDRGWLEFDEDIYTLEELESGQTAITRTTTYSSSLRPRWYWEKMEQLTISSEQDFVFRNLHKDLVNLHMQASR